MQSAIIKKQKLVAKLNRALYGLKQAPRAWHQELTCILQKLGYLQSFIDQGVYYRFLHDRIYCVLLVYVDDVCLIISPHMQAVTEFKAEFMRHVNIKDLGH